MSGLDVREKLSYMHDNPVRASIVERSEDYLMSSAKDYSGTSGLVTIEIV
jgi:putative transposase